MTKQYLGNWVKQTVTIGGTGNLTIGAVEGFPTLAEAIGFNKTFHYALLNANLSPLELGTAHLTDAITLVRETVYNTYLAGVYATSGLTPSNVPANSILMTAATKELLQNMLLEMSLYALGNVSGAVDVDLHYKAITCNLTSNATLSFTNLPPTDTKHEFTLHVNSNNAGDANIAKGYLLTLPNNCYIGANLAPPLPLAYGVKNTIRLSTVDGGTTYQVFPENRAAMLRDLGSIGDVTNASMLLDIRHPHNKATLVSSTQNSLTFSGVSPSAKYDEPAHFVFKNNGAGSKALIFNSSLFTIIGSTIHTISVPMGYKADLTIRRNPLSNDNVEAYDVWLNGINYDVTASGLATTWNPSDKHSDITLTNGNKTAEKTGAVGDANRCVRAFGGKSSGKWRFAVRIDTLWAQTTVNSCHPLIGIMDAGAVLTSIVGFNATSYAIYPSQSSSSVFSFIKVNNNVSTSVLTGQLGADALGDVIGVLVDLDANKIWFTRNVDVLGGGAPELGTGEAFSILDGLIAFPAIGFREYGANSAGVHTLLNEVEDPYVNTWPSFETWTA